jgi:hypothetical protein
MGLQLHAIRPANAAALVAAGLFSVILFPVIALQLLRSSAQGLAPLSVSAPRSSGYARHRVRSEKYPASFRHIVQHDAIGQRSRDRPQCRVDPSGGSPRNAGAQLTDVWINDN